MRFRLKDERSYIPYTWTDYNPDGSVYTTGSSYSTRVGTHEQMEDCETPRYHQRIANGEVIVNPVSKVSSTVVGKSAHHSFGTHPIWGRREMDGDVAGYLIQQGAVFPFVGDISLAQSRALIKAHEAIDEPAVLGAVNVYELASTVKMLTSPFSGAISLLKKMSKRRRKLMRAGLSAAKAASNVWLEYRYGWQPLMLDAESIIDRCQTMKVVRPRGAHRVARGGENLPNRKWVSSEAAIPPAVSQAKFTRTLEWRARIGAGVIYDVIDDAASDSWQAAMGLRLQDIPSSIWEAVPLSFVADWFVGIGPWLNAIVPKPNIRVRGNWVTTVETYIHYISEVLLTINVLSSPVTTYTSTAPGAQSVYEKYTRATNLQLPSLPAFEAPLSMLHTIDGLALSLGRITTGLSRFR